MNHEWINSDGERFSPWGFYALVAMFVSPIVYCCVGCGLPIGQQQPQATTEPQAPRSAWVITDVAEPIKAEPPRTDTSHDPKAAPVPDAGTFDPSLGVVVPPGFVKTKLPETGEPKYTQPQPSRAEPVYQEPVYESTPRRGLFRGRWRGGSTSGGASAAGSC